MVLEQLKIKAPNNYDWDDIIYINDFDKNSLEIIKRESKIGVNIYYIKYSTLRPFYFVINRLIGYITEIKGSSDKYLVVFNSSHNNKINMYLYNIWESIKDDSDLPIKQVFKIHSITDVIKSLIEKNNTFYLKLSLNHCLYKL